MRRRSLLAAATALVLVAVAVTVWLVQRAGDEPAPRATPTSAPSTTSTPAPDQCAEAASRPFTPTSVTLSDRRYRVLALPRDGRNVPGVPPLTAAGRTEVAWDRPPGIKPGSSRGNVLLNAHTWPDGSALGNRLLRSLHRGDRIVVHGRSATQCYEVTRRIEVRADGDAHGYYDRTGRPQVAIVVCSGERTGPGQWSHRTLWFAKAIGA